MDKNKYFKILTRELHRPITKKFKRAQVITTGINDIFAADLADMSQFADENDGYKYLLTVIDCFSRFAWAVPIKDKKGDTVLDAFKEIVVKSKRKPNRLWVDQGKEFVNHKMVHWLKENNILIYHTYGEHKASICERFNRTLKSLMWRRLTYEQNDKWIPILPELLHEYNNTKHSAIKMTPIEASKKENENDLWKYQYADSIEEAKEPENTESKIKLGDWVRISKTKRTFEKGYTPNWSHEIFKVVGKNLVVPPTFILEDWNGERIKGSFYEPELQTTQLADQFIIEKVLETKVIKGVKMALVKWLGYKEPTWTEEANIKELEPKKEPKKEEPKKEPPKKEEPKKEEFLAARKHKTSEFWKTMISQI